VACLKCRGCPEPEFSQAAKGSLQHREAVQEKPAYITLVRLRIWRFSPLIADEDDSQAQNSGDRRRIPHDLAMVPP